MKTPPGHAERSSVSRVDLLISLVALLVSATSVGIALQNSRTERDLIAASSWPFLQASKSASYDAQGDADLSIENVGVGPAKIVSVTVFYDGKPVSSGADLLRSCCGLNADPTIAAAQLSGSAHYTTISETVLRTGAGVAVMLVHDTPRMPRLHQAFVAALHRLDFATCYCSVLGQCWTSDLKSVEARPVKACPNAAQPFVPDGR